MFHSYLIETYVSPHPFEAAEKPPFASDVSLRPQQRQQQQQHQQQQTIYTSIESLQATSPFAYVFLLAGCDPEQPFYRGFLFNILLAADQFKNAWSSQADVVVMIRMSSSSSSSSNNNNAIGTKQMQQPPRLPSVEEEWLQSVNAKIVYLPAATVDKEQNKNETFQDVQFLKFHVLQLLQYQRILFLDSDVLPLCNLDYLFEMSVAGILRENMVLAWTKAPANGGFFMLQPVPGAYEQIQTIRQQQRDASRNLPLPKFDKVQGWGRTMNVNDPWYSFQKRLSGHKWSFYASYLDQGLLYHYVKFVRQSVSIVLGKTVQNFRPSTDGLNTTVVLDMTLHEPFVNVTCRRQTRKRRKDRYFHHPATGNQLAHIPPYGDFAHFYSIFKPWENSEAARAVMKTKNDADNVLEYWFFLLRRLNERLKMGLPLPRNGDDKAWRKYSAIFRAEDHLGGNRVPSLKELARQNRSIYD